MDRHLIIAIVKHEVARFRSNRRVLLSVLIFIAVWGGITIPRMIVSFSANNLPAISFIFLPTVLAMYVVYITSNQVFYSEKKDGKFETLMCSPLSLKSFWLGKVISAVIPAQILGLLFWLGMSFYIILSFKNMVVFSGPFLAYFIFVLPVFLSSFVGLLAFFQMYFGLKENRFVSIVVFIIIFALLGAGSALVGLSGLQPWLVVLIALLVGILMLGVLSFLMRFLSVERIITTIE